MFGTRGKTGRVEKKDEEEEEEERGREGERKEGKGFNTLNNFIRMNSLSLSLCRRVCVSFSRGTFSHPCVSVCVLIGPSAPNPKNLVFSAGIFLLQLIYLKVTPHPPTHTHTHPSRQSPLQNTMQNIRVGHALFSGASGERWPQHNAPRDSERSQLSLVLVCYLSRSSHRNSDLLLKQTREQKPAQRKDCSSGQRPAFPP